MPSTFRVVAACAVAVASAVFVAPTASAESTSPLTYPQLAADPTIQATNTAVSRLTAVDFTLAGQQRDVSGALLVDERISHRNSTYRTWIAKGGRSYVIVSDARQSCTRLVTRKSPDTYRADLKARWQCRKGPDPLTAGEVAAVTPLGLAQVIDTTSVGSARFVPTAISDGVQVTVAAAGGAPVASYSVTGSPTGRFTVALNQGSVQTASFTLTPGAADRVPVIKHLKR